MIQIYNFCQKIYIFQKIVYVTYCKCERRMHGKQSNCNWLRIVRRIGFVEEQPHFRKKVVNVPKISIKTRCDPFKAHINWKQHNTFGKWYDHLDFDGRKKKLDMVIFTTLCITSSTLIWELSKLCCDLESEIFFPFMLDVRFQLLNSSRSALLYLTSLCAKHFQQVISLDEPVQHPDSY